MEKIIDMHSNEDMKELLELQKKKGCSEKETRQIMNLIYESTKHLADKHMIPMMNALEKLIRDNVNKALVMNFVVTVIVNLVVFCFRMNQPKERIVRWIDEAHRLFLREEGKNKKE